jgi:hypothetical protein
MEKCDSEVFKKGQSLAAVDARSAAAQKWVEKVAEKSGQRVDWHYSGGVAHVLVLGDHAKALAVAQEMARDPDVRVMRWFSAEDAGCYRAGVTPIPEDVVAVDVTGSL